MPDKEKLPQLPRARNMAPAPTANTSAILIAVKMDETRPLTTTDAQFTSVTTAIAASATNCSLPTGMLCPKKMQREIQRR